MKLCIVEMEVEKALRIINKGDPLEAHELIRQLEAIIKSPSQLSSSDEWILFLKLLDRVFSEDVTKGGVDPTSKQSSSTSGSGTDSNADTWVKGQLGGWLRIFIQYNSSLGSSGATLDGGNVSTMPNISSLVQRNNSSRATSAGASLPIGQKLIHQLFPFNPFMKLVDEYQTHLQWNINFLPQKVSLLLTNRAAHFVVDSFSSHLLYSGLQSSTKIGKDVGLRSYFYCYSFV